MQDIARICAFASSNPEACSPCLQEGYDLRIGTSEHGSLAPSDGFKLPQFQHLLLVFGGPLGLEDLFSQDSTAPSPDPKETFDMYINTCPRQGSRTIRTEEAILISLGHLQTVLDSRR